MYILLAAAQIKVLVEFLRVPSGAQHRRRFPFVRPARERIITQLRPKVPATKRASSASPPIFSVLPFALSATSSSK
jgi:hypothetical protein